MDFERLKEQYQPILHDHLWVIVLGLVGIGCLGYGLIHFLVTRGDSSEITFQSSEQQTILEKKPALKEITVDIEGAVLKPGIHKLPADSRVQEALLSAGGMSEKADRVKVARGMNLAAKVIDGGKIYIPFEGEIANASVGLVEGSDSGSSLLGSQTNGVININTASEAELDSLSGVGPATAQKIISARPYSSIDELLSKKVVGKSVFEKIKEKVTVN